MVASRATYPHESPVLDTLAARCLRLSRGLRVASVQSIWIAGTWRSSPRPIWFVLYFGAFCEPYEPCRPESSVVVMVRV